MQITLIFLLGQLSLRNKCLIDLGHCTYVLANILKSCPVIQIGIENWIETTLKLIINGIVIICVVLIWASLMI